MTVLSTLYSPAGKPIIPYNVYSTNIKNAISLATFDLMEGTRLKCAETSRRVRSVSTGTSVSSLMAAASSGRSSGIQNTRPNTARSKNYFVLSKNVIQASS